MVTDPLDIASDLAEIYNQAALENHKSKTRTDKESAFFCIDCDEVIPHARRAAIKGVQLCVPCQQANETKQKQVAR